VVSHMSGIPINWKWWTFHVLCTSAKVKVIDRVDRIRALMVLLSSEYAPNLVRSSGKADGHAPSGMVSIGRV
jgi:hypothetical protein